MKRDDQTRRVKTERRPPTLGRLPALLKEERPCAAANEAPTVLPVSPPWDGRSPLCGVELSRDGVRLTLPLGRSIVGRVSTASIVLDNQDVSREHACVIVEASRALIRDLSSANGTTLNGRLVREAPLKSGDRLAFAGVTFDVQLVGLGADQDE
jgi:hypothetical protein